MSDGVRIPRRPPGWIAPGPPPAGARGSPDLAPRPDEDLCLLSGDWRIFQKRRGHRWSLDDLVTAWVACDGPAPRRALDLGCGIGSVLMMVAWRFPDAQLVGVEAQEESARMARRSLAYNGADARTTVRDGDLRDAALVPEHFDLVTGTPPYFAEGEGALPVHAQSLACRFETRGGAADYCAAAARTLAPNGRFVMCAAALEEDRVREGARSAGLTVLSHLHVIPRDGKEELVHVFTMEIGEPSWPDRATHIVVRDRTGAWTEEFRGVRRAMGMPDRP
jgi:tRNA1Val (adenine37-N6)-methyltransferase